MSATFGPPPPAEPQTAVMKGHARRIVLPARWEVPAFDLIEFAPRRTVYCIGIPVINEDGRLWAQLRKMRDLGIHEVVDIVIADGGSTDGSVSPETLSPMSVRALLVKQGPGRLSAQLRMFFAYAISEGYEGLITVDGNNKDGVEDIPAFAHALEQGWDYVQGSRYITGGLEENTPLLRKIGVRWIHAPLLSLASGFRYTDTTNGFRGIRRRFLLDERLQPFRAVFDTYNLHYYLSLMAPRLRYRVTEVPVSRVYPKGGVTPSKIGGFRGYLHIFTLLIKTILGTYNPRFQGR